MMNDNLIDLLDEAARVVGRVTNRLPNWTVVPIGVAGAVIGLALAPIIWYVGERDSD